MKALTFKEVIANIKEGEVWENCGEDWNIKEISYSKKEESGNSYDGIKIIFRKEIDNYTFQDSSKFKLKRNKVSFKEAFKAYEEGKEIESCVSKWTYKIVEEMVKIDTNGNGTRTYDIGENTFSTTEIKGEWYIN